MGQRTVDAVTPPCPGCPWRVAQTPDVIPGYDLELAEGLVETTRTDLAAPQMACHHSRVGEEIVCRGWLVRHGWDSIAVRLRLMSGDLSPSDLEPGADWPELHVDFAEMIAKLRSAS